MTEQEARQRILGAIDREGAATIQMIPRRWPMTRIHIRLFIRRLLEEGYLQAVRPEAGAAEFYRLTRKGKGSLERELKTAA
ncbi:MAG: hypothetical protein AB7I33_04200 [Gemmatimonadales bacterium]